MKKYSTIINLLSFQGIWWTSVLEAKHSTLLLGPIVTVLYLFIHLNWISKTPKKELLFILICAPLGYLCDSLFFNLNFISFPLTSPPFAPLWLLMIWLGFSTTVGHSFAWLSSKKILAAVLGAIFGPLSYAAGIKFGLVDFPSSLKSLIILSLFWSLVMPFSLFTYSKLKIPKTLTS